MRVFVLAIAASLIVLAAARVNAAPDSADRDASGATLDHDRYTMHETFQGWLRLERDSGKVSLCKARNSHWTCVPVADAATAYEAEIKSLETGRHRLRRRLDKLNGRLGATQERAANLTRDNRRLKDRIGELESRNAQQRERARELEKHLGEIEEALRTPPPSATGPGYSRPPAPPQSAPLPDAPSLSRRGARELDRFIDLSERMFHRFFGMVKTLKRDFEERT